MLRCMECARSGCAAFVRGYGAIASGHAGDSLSPGVSFETVGVTQGDRNRRSYLFFVGFLQIGADQAVTSISVANAASSFA